MNKQGQPVTVARYLWARLRGIGVDSVHGVPGDYNLNLLDSISSEGLRWVGNCNELNAGYAADGYARIKGIGAIVTTGGVGELSAINAHAGAFAERVSVIHIVGSPALSIRGNGKFSMHHTLGNNAYDVFSNMFKPISAAQVSLQDTLKVPEQIDMVLKACWISGQPVYINVPSDMANQLIDGSRLLQPLDLSHPVNDEEQQTQAVGALSKRLNSAKRPCILVDMHATKQRFGPAVKELIRRSGLPIFVTPLAQGFVDDYIENYGGIYAGKGSHPGVQDFLEGSDMVLHVGPLDTDVTTYLGSANLNKDSMIRISPSELQMGNERYSHVHLDHFISAILDQVEFPRISPEQFQKPLYSGDISTKTNKSITHEWLWPYISHWLQPGDIVLTDTGTASFGILHSKFPPEAMLINISFWASIGYSLPSAQGAALAAQDSQSVRRTILFQGDGSFQLTCQEISTMIRYQLQVTIFVICNNGYTIERAVHETKESYNDIMNWNYREILRVFDKDSKSSRSFQVHTQEDLKALLTNEDFSSYKYVQLVELHMPELDIPPPLIELSKLIKAKQAVE